MGADQDQTIYYTFMDQLCVQAQQTVPTDPLPWVPLEVLKETVATFIENEDLPAPEDYELVKSVYR